MTAQKRPFNEGKRHFKKSKKQKTSTVSDGSNEEVLLADVRQLLKRVRVADDPAGTEAVPPPEQWSEIDVYITELSSTGDGLAHKDGQVYVVPFTAPGDTVTAKIFKHFPGESYTIADFVEVVEPSQRRTETPRCRYFTQCSGCQFQHLPYAYQLAHKRSIVEKAYRNFSRLPTMEIPVVGDTIGSPLQYGYRTKLTPHFEGPPSGRGDRRKGLKVTWPEVPPIGFMRKGSRKTMDIEECPIGTEAVQKGLVRERKRVAEHIDQYQRGATLLLRENTERVVADGHGVADASTNGNAVAAKKDDFTNEADAVVEDRDGVQYRKTCITDARATSSEYVDDFRFDNPAGAFFQNNNSILPLVTQYIREHILGPPAEGSGDRSIKHMIDAYCGSGFFTVALSTIFQSSIGIDISAQSITFAKRNAALNNRSAESTHFIAADANGLFASISPGKFPPKQTAVVIDPPRKGCDENFIRQLLQYGPERICYVSCNVHTQARDVGWLVGGLPNDEGLLVGGLYEIESLRGFDFFPQTSHVEGVAMLRRRSPRPA